jgi:hypothetical protein
MNSANESSERNEEWKTDFEFAMTIESAEASVQAVLDGLRERFHSDRELFACRLALEVALSDYLKTAASGYDPNRRCRATIAKHTGSLIVGIDGAERTFNWP